MFNTSFNKFTCMPYYLYNIVVHLAQDPNAEDLFKLLKYKDYDALNKPNLTLSEKLSMVWKNEADENRYSIFFTNLIENEQVEERTILKIYTNTISPTNAQTAIVSFEFDVLNGAKMVMVDYKGIPCSRLDVAESIILGSLNGADINGIGNLQFNRELSRLDSSMIGIGNSTNFTGVAIIMSVMASNLSKDGC